MSTPPASLQLTDDQQVNLTVEAEDTKGQEVTDTFSWSVDNGDVIALTVSADTTGCLCVAGTTGAANVTVTDSSTPPLTAVQSFTVVAGAAAQLVVTPGAIEAQP
jgi:hypothetical protein